MALPSVLIDQAGEELSHAEAAPARGLQSNGVLGYLQSCFGPQFDCCDANGTSRVIQWVRALAQDIAARDAKRIAAIGMCLTGAFPLALMDMPDVVGAVLSQPALPLRNKTELERRSLGLTAEEIARARDRCDGRFLALRFSNDMLCPAERFETLETLLGARLQRKVIPSGAGEQFPVEAHAVLTGWYRSDPTSATREAFEDVVTLLQTVVT